MQRPIGIFDSGIGGLTVAKAIKKVMPNESIVYFGDTAHLPYGDKSADSIRHYAARISAFLINQKCKAVVIACNTASSMAYQTVSDICGLNIPVINVIDPVVEYVCEHHHKSKVGVIGTKGTIHSRAYPNRIQKLDRSISVVSQATPLLAPMIEEGFYNNQISKTIIASYLSKKSFEQIDALILGCTHYPLIKKEVVSFYHRKTDVIDSALVVAKYVDKVLTAMNLRSEGKAEYTFFVSDYTDSFERSTRLFFKEKIHLEEKRLFD